MRLAWLFGEFAHADFKLTRRQRVEITNLAHRQFLAPGALIRYTLLWVLPPVAAAFIMLPLVLEWTGLSGKNVPFMIGAGTIVVLSWPWSAWAYHRLYDRPCRRAMIALGRTVCVGCGYCLEGLELKSIELCPECGEKRTPIQPPAALTSRD